MVITGRRLTPDGKRMASKRKFFLPVWTLSAKYRGKFMALLGQKFPGSNHKLIDSCYKKAGLSTASRPWAALKKSYHIWGAIRIVWPSPNNHILFLSDGRGTFLWRD